MSNDGDKVVPLKPTIEERVKALTRVSDLVVIMEILKDLLDISNLWGDDKKVKLDNIFTLMYQQTDKPKKILEATFRDIAENSKSRQEIVKQERIRNTLDVGDEEIEDKYKLARCIQILRSDPRLIGKFKYNTFLHRIELHHLDKIEPYSDIINIDATILLQHMGINVTTNVVYEAMQSVSRYNKYNPVTDYLDSLVWDGVERLEKAGAIYWGARTAIECIFIRKQLLGAVYRAFEPGCQHDTYVVLEGPQGIYKSTSIRSLMPDPIYFTDQQIDIKDKDALMIIRSKWMIELSELDSLSKHEESAIKAFMSRRVDVLRDPYGKIIAEYPRQNVFWGSVNKEGYLKDSTGNRRTWPVKCGQIDLNAIVRDRDQLWAEAVIEYRRREPHWLTTTEEMQQNQITESRMETSILHERVEAWITSDVIALQDTFFVIGIEKGGWDWHREDDKGYKNKFTKQELYNGIGLDWRNKSYDIVVAGILQRLGYTSKPTRKAGVSVRLYMR